MNEDIQNKNKMCSLPTVWKGLKEPATGVVPKASSNRLFGTSKDTLH